MQENLDFLTTLEIDNHEFTSISLNLLTKLFKVSSYIKVLKITNSHFPSPDSFCLLCNSLQNNTCLQELNLSKNNLTDNYGMYICDLIVNSSSIKEVNLDLNLFKNTDFGQCFSVSSIESISINNNPLSESVVLSILSSCKSNKNLKNLNIHGKMAQGEIFESKLAEVLESTKLVKLGFDLSFKSQEVLQQIEKSLVNSNKSLVVFTSDLIDWDEVNESHQAFPLKKALLANMWFHSQDLLSLEKYEGLFKEIQGIIQKKINKDEISSKDEREVAATPDFKENTGKSSYEISKLVSNSGSFAYSDSSFIETREKAILNLDERVKFHSLNDCFDVYKNKLDKFTVKFQESIGLLEERVEKIERLNQNSLIESQELDRIKVVQELSDFEMKIEEKIESFNQEIGKKLTSYINSPVSITQAINEEITKIQEKVEYNTEEIKQLEMKLEKQYFHVKSTFKKLNSVYANQTQIQAIESRIEASELKLEEFNEKVILTEDKSLNSFLEIENLTKSFQVIQRNLSESERKLKDFHTNLSTNEEKVNNTLKIRDLIKLRDEEIYQKIYSLECEILEVKNSDKFEKLNNEIQKIEFKLSQVEEVCQKNQENNCFQFTEQNLLINELQQKVLNINLPLSNYISPEEHSEVLELSNSEYNSIVKSPKDKFDYSKSLATRLEKLEKLNIHKKALEVTKNYEDEFDFVPGHAESIVRTAVLEKVNKLSGKSNTLAYRTIGPYSQKLSSSFFDDDSHIEKSSRRYDYKSFYNS